MLRYGPTDAVTLTVEGCVRVRRVREPREWDSLISSFSLGHVLQSYQWGEVKAAYGWRPIRLAVEDGGVPMGAAQLLVRGLPWGAVAYVPRGPLIDFSNSRALDALLEAIHAEARGQGAVFLKMEPDLPTSSDAAGLLAERGFRRGVEVQPRSSLVVDLAAEPSALFQRLSARARYNVRLAQRGGLKCEVGGEADLPDFCRLLEETAQRGGFALHARPYYTRIWEQFAPLGLAHLLLVRFGREALAATMFLTTGGRAFQFYSGSAHRLRRLKPSELLQWSALLHARDLGCRSYDLWGIPDDVGCRLERGVTPAAARGEQGQALAGTMHGVYQFKKGFGGSVARTVGAFDYVYAPARYWLWVRMLPAARCAVLAARGRPDGREGRSTTTGDHEAE